MSAALDRVLRKLPGARRGNGAWHSTCPCCREVDALAVWPLHDGTVRMACWSGCERAHVLAGLGLSDAELTPTQSSTPRAA